MSGLLRSRVPRLASPRPSSHLYEWLVNRLVCSKSYVTPRATPWEVVRQPVQDLAAGDLSIRAGDATRSCQILSRSRHGANGGAIAVAMSRMVAAALSPRATTCKFDFAEAIRRGESTTEQQQAELPLEHVGPEPKDAAQLCVAEASKSDK